MNSAGHEHRHEIRKPFPKVRPLTFSRQQTTRHEKAQRRVRQQTTVENLFRRRALLPCMNFATNYFQQFESK